MIDRAQQTLVDALRGAFRMVLGSRPSQWEGSIAASGVDGRITIYRDGFGVPTIIASSERDAWFGLGFCHGQDRAGQLEVFVRTVRGTLSEIAGPDALAIDRLMRRLGLSRAAAAQLAVARPTVRAQLEAYVRGVNHALSCASAKKAHDLVLFGCDPTMWRASDVQALNGFLCFALASNWDVELVRLEMLALDGPGAVQALDATYPHWLPTSLHPKSALSTEGARAATQALRADLERLDEWFALRGGSNAWAVHASRTRTGRPIVASDPHLEPAIPAHWYLAHLVAPGLHLRGATFVGIPGMGVGHNEHVAWGVTAAHVDNTDLFIEEIHPEKKSVRHKDGFIPCETRIEVIAVKGQPAFVEEVLITPRGPIVSPVLEGSPAALSLSATWLRPRPYTGLLRAHEAGTVAELQELFREGSTSSVALVAADVHGQIAFRTAVEVPIRKVGHGLVPLPAAGGEVGFREDLVPFDQLPNSCNPETGFVATANNSPDHGNVPYLGLDFMDGYRIRAIVAALFEKDDWDVTTTLELQRSVRSIPWEELRHIVLALPRTATDIRTALELLDTWDGRVAHDSPAASVFSLFMAYMTRRIVEAKAPRTAKRSLGQGFNPLLPHNTMLTRRSAHLMSLLQRQPSGFLPEGFEVAMLVALRRTVQELNRHFGSDSSAWSWGRVRPLRLAHLFSRVNPALDRVFGIGPLPFSGDATTIAQGAVDLLHPRSNPFSVPNLRVVIDVGNFANSRFGLLGGQSGNPVSEHYADQVALWNEGGRKLAWSQEDAASSARYTLRLG